MLRTYNKVDEDDTELEDAKDEGPKFKVGDKIWVTDSWITWSGSAGVVLEVFRRYSVYHNKFEYRYKCKIRYTSPRYKTTEDIIDTLSENEISLRVGPRE